MPMKQAPLPIAFSALSVASVFHRRKDRRTVYRKTRDRTYDKDGLPDPVEQTMRGDAVEHGEQAGRKLRSFQALPV